MIELRLLGNVARFQPDTGRWTVAGASSAEDLAEILNGFPYPDTVRGNPYAVWSTERTYAEHVIGLFRDANIRVQVVSVPDWPTPPAGEVF